MQKCKLGKNNLEASVSKSGSMGLGLGYDSFADKRQEVQTAIERGVDNCVGSRHQSHLSESVVIMERALASFHAAVAEEYGSDEAAKAAQDWIEEVQKSDGETCSDWRSVTIAAARRLARRVAKLAQD